MTWSVDITPIKDTKEHRQGNSCWCNPHLTDDGVWIHNAADERELTEEKPRA